MIPHSVAFFVLLRMNEMPMNKQKRIVIIRIMMPSAQTL